MPLTAYVPKDLAKYKRHPDSAPFSPELSPGAYVFVQDVDGTVWVAPNGRHVHPKILGGARPVVAAGEITVEQGGLVVQINNLSGTFECQPDSLLTAVGGLVMQGAQIEPGAVTTYEV